MPPKTLPIVKIHRDYGHAEDYKFIDPAEYPATSQKPTKERWLKAHEELHIGIIKHVSGEVLSRIITPVKHFGTDIIYMMDAITGTLYQLGSGRCLSSDQLTLTAVLYTTEGAKIIRSIKPGGLA